MTEGEGKSKKMATEEKRDRTNLLALTGTAALLALAVNLVVSAFNSHKKRTKKKGSLSLPHSPIYFRSNIFSSFTIPRSRLVRFSFVTSTVCIIYMFQFVVASRSSRV